MLKRAQRARQLAGTVLYSKLLTCCTGEPSPPTYVARVLFRNRGQKWVRWLVLHYAPRGFSPVFISKFQFDQMQDLPENHFRVNGASWANITN